MSWKKIDMANQRVNPYPPTLKSYASLRFSETEKNTLRYRVLAAAYPYLAKRVLLDSELRSSFTANGWVGLSWVGLVDECSCFPFLLVGF